LFPPVGIPIENLQNLRSKKTRKLNRVHEQKLCEWTGMESWELYLNR
jgi:hypothetical protein